MSAGELLRYDLHSFLFSYTLVPSTSRIEDFLLIRALCTLSVHLFLGRPTDLIPAGLHWRYLVGFLSSSILIICQYHLNLFLSISSSNGVTCSSSRVSVLRILSLLVTFLIFLKNLISTTCSLDCLRF